MADDLNQLIKPAGAGGANGDEPVIHVIPEKFYGAALKKNVAKSNPTATPTGAGAGTPPQPPANPDDSPIPPLKPKKKKGSIVPVIIIAVLVLLLGGLAAYYFLVLSKPPAQTNTNVPQVNTNTAPVGPVCGNARCETGETFASCSADCQPPAPVCGDQKCDATESNDSCPADCAPPAPVCGNSQCEEPTETEASCPADCAPPAPTVGADADSDGLSDEEEASVFGTNPNDPNTDKDSFVDLNEALNLFDPAKPSPSSLRDAAGIAVYANADQQYEIFRPSSWVVREEGTAKDSVFFSAQGGEFVQVLMQERTDDGSLLDWYLAQSPGVSATQVVTYKTRQGNDALISPDQLVHYVALGNRIAVVTYNVGQRNELHYKITFQMMVQSLRGL